MSNTALSLSQPTIPRREVSRRKWIIGSSFLTAASSAVNPSYGYTTPSSPPPPLILSKSSSSIQPPRIEEIGGGFDLLSPPPLKAVDAIYPASMLGLWECRRAVVLSEGDTEQARLAWKALGGGDTTLSDEAFTNRKTERFYTKFVNPPQPNADTVYGASAGNPYQYQYEGNILTGVIVDRVFETQSRLDQTVLNADTKSTATLVEPTETNRPISLRYETASGTTVALAVVERTIEPPNENGFGYNELVRITTAAGGLVPGNVVRAARVKRRFRRAFDKDGNRVVEGLEIVKTYRVLDGVARVEMPTSTTKSQIQLSRPSSA